jgi:hypothetical protein
MGDALLTHEGDGYDTYDQTLFYAVRLAAQCEHGNTETHTRTAQSACPHTLHRGA